MNTVNTSKLQKFDGLQYQNESKSAFVRAFDTVIGAKLESKHLYQQNLTTPTPSPQLIRFTF